MSCECKKISVSTDLIAWCLTCNKRFCASCRGSHSHNDNFHFCINISEKCLVHDEPLQYLCFDHDQLCCNSCYPVNHGTCTKIEQASACAQNVFNSTEVLQAENKLKEIETNLVTHMANRQQNAKVIEQQTLWDLEDIRQDMMGRVNQLIDDMKNYAKFQCEETAHAMERPTKKLIDLQGHVECVTARFGQMKAELSNLQLLNAVKQLSRELNTAESKVSDLCDQEAALETTLGRRLGECIHGLLSKSRNLSEIDLPNSQGDAEILDIEHAEEGQASISPRTPFDISKPQLRIIREIAIDENREVTGCGIFPDSRMIFVHSNYKPARIYNQDGSTNEVFFLYPQSSVTVIDNSRIAISAKNERSIFICHMGRCGEQKTVQFENNVLACSYHEECIYVLIRDVGIAVVDMDGKTLKIIRVPVSRNCGSIQCSDVGICYTIPGLYTIFCDYSGHVKWKNPLGGDGISMDSRHNVFVTSAAKRNVRAISVDGKTEVDLLPPNNDFPLIKAICCDRKHNTLLVVVSKERAILYGFS